VHRSSPGLVLFSAVLACCCVGSAVAAPMGVVVATLALACTNNVDTPSGLSELLKGAAQLRPDDAKRFLKSNEGSAYWFKFDTGQMVAAIKAGGGCEIVSQEASRRDLESFVFEGFRQLQVPHRALTTERQNQFVRNTFAVTYKGTHLFLTIFGPDDPSLPGGIDVDVSREEHRPKHLSAQTNIEWPK
jgi:hypothetical protein